MKNLWDHLVSIDMSAAISNSTIREAKRGSKRLCGRIVNNRREAVTDRPVDAGHGSSDLFFDSTSGNGPWFR